MLLELHCHTARYSPCSHLDPVEAVRRARAKGLQGLVLTEHHALWSEAELAELRRQAELERSFVLLSGQECSTDHGHVLIFGAPETLPEGSALAEIRRRFPEAALVWAHPFRGDHRPADKKLLAPALDAVEIFNSNHSARGHYLAISAWHRLKFTATAGSDAHHADTVGLYPTLLDHPVATIDALALELRRGRCRPLFKEIPKSGAKIQVTEITVGTKGEDEQRQRIIVKHLDDGPAWESALASVEIGRLLRRTAFHGGALRVPEILEVSEGERLVIEESQRGKSLFELLQRVDLDVGERYLRLALRWLAELHRQRIAPPASLAGKTRAREQASLERYLQRFEQARSPYTEKIRAWTARVQAGEAALWPMEAERFVLCHGDFHPKNIIVGQDRMHDFSTTFVSVIDFGSAISFVPAFDLGAFVAQLRFQLRASPEVQRRFDRGFILEAYGAAQDEAFAREVQLFEVRAGLNIAAFLVKVGLGLSEEMTAVLGGVEAALLSGA